MAAPISNNPALIGGNKPARTEEQSPGQAGGQDKGRSLGASVQGDAVSVSRAAQVLNEQPVERERGQGAVQSAEGAAQVAQSLKILIEKNGARALAAQTNNVSSDLMDLLKVS